MTQPYITQMIAEAYVAEMLATAERRRSAPRRRHGSKARPRIRAWWQAQLLHRRPRPTGTVCPTGR